MPVRRFRSVAAMDDAVWRSPGDPALYRTMAALWQLARRTSPRRFRPGVYKRKGPEDLSPPEACVAPPAADLPAVHE